MLDVKPRNKGPWLSCPSLCVIWLSVPFFPLLVSHLSASIENTRSLRLLTTRPWPGQPSQMHGSCKPELGVAFRRPTFIALRSLFLLTFLLCLLSLPQLTSCATNKTELYVLWMYPAPISDLAHGYSLDRARLRLDALFDLEGAPLFWCHFTSTCCYSPFSFTLVPMRGDIASFRL